jgi:DNA polymerase-3 subunit epsilon
MPAKTDLEAMAAALEQTGRYEVLRRFEPPGRYADPDGTRTGTALAVDVETTGLDHAQDRIIQFSAVPFTYAKDTGRIYQVSPAATYFEDPGRPLPPEITALTGISDDQVRGQHIEDAAVRALADKAALVIAHNAGFDRAFVEKRLPAFQEKPWACSIVDVEWPAGLGSTKLEFLLYKHCGLFFAAHTAEADCLALIHLLATPFTDGALPMARLLQSARRKTMRIWATGTSFETKDLLKARQYHWHAGGDGRPKAWYRDLPEAEGAAELDWLCDHIYAGVPGRWQTETFGAERRYSPRV